MTTAQQAEIDTLTEFYGRYPGLKTHTVEYQDGSVHFTAHYLVPVDEHDDEGTFPEAQSHWIAASGAIEASSRTHP